MAKIKLGSAPKSFKHKVAFALLDGSKADITIEFRYRNRAQFAEFIADIYPDLKAGPKKADDEVQEVGFDVVGSSREASERDVNYILAAATGWDLEEDFNAANVQHLVNDFPAASNAIMAAYRIALTEGKAKN